MKGPPLVSSDFLERPRAFERAAALYLARSDFADSWRRDGVGSCWRRQDDDGSGEWLRVAELAEVVTDAAGRLSEALADDPPPFEFALVYAPTVLRRDGENRLPLFLDVGDLAACGSWEDVRLRLDARARAYGLPWSGWSPWMTREQRERLLRDAGRDSKVQAALRMASGLPSLRYAAGAVEADPERAFLACHVARVPGATVRTSAVYDAYEATAKAAGRRPMGRREFRRVAEDVLGCSAMHTRAGDVFLGVALRDVSAAAAPSSSASRRSA